MAALPDALPPCPATPVDEAGAPRFGSYQGAFSRVDLDRLAGSWARGPLYRLAHLKKWQWTMVATPEVLAGFAIVDLTYAANAFAFVADLAQRRMVADASALGLPAISAGVSDRPGEGARARFAAPGARLSVERPVGSSQRHLEVRLKRIHLTATLDAAAAPPPLTLVAPVDSNGLVNVTQKSVGLAAHGALTVGDRTWSLDGGTGGFDFTFGLLGRHTAWRWAFATGKAADGRGVGFNLVHGFNGGAGGTENALWLGDRLLPLAEAAFTFDPKQPDAPWRVTTADGRVDLSFRPVGRHLEDRNLLVARSYFLQVFGTWSGTIAVGADTVRVEGLPGVAEDQRITW